MDFANHHHERRSVRAFKAVETSVSNVDTDYLDFGDPEDHRFLADSGKRLHVSHWRQVRIRINVTTANSLDWTLEHATRETSTLRDFASGTVEANGDTVVFEEALPPGWVALDISGKTGLEVEITGADDASEGGAPQVSAGSQIMTPGSSTKIDVQPASQGSVTKGKCEVTYINHGTEQAWVNEQGVGAAEGVLLDPKDAWTDEEVTVSPTQHTVYFPSSDGIGSNPGTGDDEDKLIIRFREEG